MRYMAAPGSRRLVAFFALLLAAVGAGLAGPALAKDVDIVGTVECGVLDGRRCAFGDEIGVVTDALSGERERVVVNVAWVKDDLPSLDQGDEICLTVAAKAGGGYRAVGILSPCGVAGTVNPGLSTGSREEAERGRRPRDDDDDKQTAVAPVVATVTPVVVTVTPGPVTVALVGTVRNAATGDPIVGATVRGPDGATTTTGAGGRFSLAAVPTGRVGIVASAPGFIDNPSTLAISNQTGEVSLALVPNQLAGSVTVTLTWGALPPDLDLNASGPATGGRFRVFFAQPRPVTYAELTRDDTSEFGPETIVVSRELGSGAFVAGEYRFWVTNFSRTPEFDVSNARIEVTQGGREIAEYLVQDASGDPSLDIWHAVNLQVDAAGNVTPVAVQRFTAGDTNTVLSVPAADAKEKQP